MTSFASVRTALRTVSEKAGHAVSAVHRGMVFLWCLPVRFYRKYVSPLKGHGSCRFTPTCSRYFIEAVGEWGILIGTALALWRVIRCNPFSEGGRDPVPTRKEAAARLSSLFRGKGGGGRDGAAEPDPRKAELPEEGNIPQRPQSPTEN